MTDIFEKQNEIITLLEMAEVNEAAGLLEAYKNTFGVDSFYYLAHSDVLLQMDAYDEIMEEMQEAVKKYPDQPAFFERMGEVRVMQEQYDEAIELLKKCDLEEDSLENLHVRYLLGRAYMGKLWFKKALSCFEDILLETEDGPTLFYAGVCYLEMDREDRAMEYFKKLEDESVFVNEICSVLIHQGSLQSLEYFMEHGAGIDEGQHAMMLAAWHHLHGNMEKSAEYLFSKADEFETAAESMMAASYFESQGNMEKALQMAHQALDLPVLSEHDTYSEVSAKLEAMDMLELSESAKGRSILELLLRRYNDAAFFLMIEFALDHGYLDLAEMWLFHVYQPEDGDLELISRLEQYKLRCLLHMDTSGAKAYAYMHDHNLDNELDQDLLSVCVSVCCLSDHLQEAEKLHERIFPNGYSALSLAYEYARKGDGNALSQLFGSMLEAFEEELEGEIEAIPGKEEFLDFSKNFMIETGIMDEEEAEDLFDCFYDDDEEEDDWPEMEEDFEDAQSSLDDDASWD